MPRTKWINDIDSLIDQFFDIIAKATKLPKRLLMTQPPELTDDRWMVELTKESNTGKKEPFIEAEDCEKCGAGAECQEWDFSAQVYYCLECGAVQ